MKRWRSVQVRLKRELRDVIELFVTPGLAVFLPWNIAFRLFKLLCRFTFLYRDAVDLAHTKAANYTTIEDSEAWKRQRRLTMLVDHADLYLAMSRPARWMDKYLDLTGQWPSSAEPALLLTFHWGAGMWVLPHMRRNHLKVHALVASLRGEQFTGRRVFQLYATLRTRQVSIELGQATIDVQNSLRPAMTALRECNQLLAVVDVPTDQTSSAEDIPFHGHVMRVPRALFRFAATQSVPITLFTIGFDPLNGRRALTIKHIGIPTNTTQSIRQVFSHLESDLETQSASWHLWSEADRFFSIPADNQQPSACTQAH